MAKIDRDAAIAVMFCLYEEAAIRWRAAGKNADAGAMLELDRAALELSRLPAEEERPAFRWIPCAVRLPEKSGKYLVTVENGNVYAGTFSAYDRAFMCAATAWAPLPEPYKEEEQDEQGAG